MAEWHWLQVDGEHLGVRVRNGQFEALDVNLLDEETAALLTGARMTPRAVVAASLAELLWEAGPEGREQLLERILWEAEHWEIDHTGQTPPLVAAQMAVYGRESMARVACISGRIPVAAARYMAQGTPEERRLLAGSPGCPAELVVVLATDLDVRVREQVAVRADLPGELLGRLASDADPAVRRSIAERRTLPQEVADALARDPFAGVREEVVHNRSLSTDSLRLLAADPDRVIASAARRYLEQREVAL